MDRNVGVVEEAITFYPSLSARRAWIEIAAIDSAPLANGGRSPQGERG